MPQMRIMIAVFVGLCLGIQGLVAQEKAAAFPASAQMVKYPVITDTTGHIAKMAEMGLHQCTLQSDWTGLNWYQKYMGSEFGRFVYETLSTGTPAFCDSDGIPRYKADCVNRLATEVDCPNCLTYKPNRSTFPVNPIPRVALTVMVIKAVERRVEVPVERSSGPGWVSRNAWWFGPTVAGVVVGGIICAFECGGDINTHNELKIRR